MLLFDEPLSNLDANACGAACRDKIRELQKQFDITSLYVTHDQSEAFAVSDTVLVMNKGISCKIGSPQDLYRQPASRFMAKLYGRCQPVPGRLQRGVRRYLWLSAAEAAAFCRPRQGSVGVRPEAITRRSRRGEPALHDPSRGLYGAAVRGDGRPEREILLQVNATRLQPDVGEHYYLEIHPYGMFGIQRMPDD